MMRRILVVEDDEHLADGLRLNLELEGHEVLVAGSAEEARLSWRRGGIDLVLLDVMLPGMDGFELCRQVRQAGDRVPILFLTARAGSRDRLRGFELGADDYIAKPFDLQELLARVRSIFRRLDWQRERQVPDVLRIGEATIDLRSREGRGPHGPFALREKEAGLLRLLAERHPEAVDRATILDRIWGRGHFPTTRTVDNFVLALRKLVEADPRHPRHILTVHGVGYRLATAPAPAGDDGRAQSPR